MSSLSVRSGKERRKEWKPCQDCPLTVEGVCDEHKVMTALQRWMRVLFFALLPSVLAVGVFLIEVRSKIAVIETKSDITTAHLEKLEDKLDKLLSYRKPEFP